MAGVQAPTTTLAPRTCTTTAAAPHPTIIAPAIASIATAAPGVVAVGTALGLGYAVQGRSTAQHRAPTAQRPRAALWGPLFNGSTGAAPLTAVAM